MTAFAGRLGAARPDARLLLDDPGAVVLVVHAAALLAVLDHAVAGGGGSVRVYSAGEVLSGLLGHEARYWHKSAVARGLVLDTGVQRLAVAVACLAGAGSETEAAGLLACVPDLAGSAERRGQVARWLHDLYPAPAGGGMGGEWLGALRPDRVAEHLVTSELDGRGELVPGLLAGLGGDRLVRALTVLGRAARDDGRAARLLRGAVEDDLEHLAVPALAVAAETNPDVAGMLTAALTAASVPKPVLEQIAGALPYPTFALAGTAVEVFQQLAAGTAPGSSERAGLLIGLSNRLGALGRREEALAAIEEAVTAYRALAQARPDVFLPDLAMSLNNQSVFLSVGAGAAGGGAGRDRGSRHRLPCPGPGPPRRVPARPRDVAEQPVGVPVCRSWGGGRRRWPRSRKPSPSAVPWPRPALRCSPAGMPAR